jgi:hypothetical protein
MPVHEVLRAGTLFGAEAIGLGKALGSLEPVRRQYLGRNLADSTKARAAPPRPRIAVGVQGI